MALGTEPGVGAGVCPAGGSGVEGCAGAAGCGGVMLVGVGCWTGGMPAAEALTAGGV